jgi:hypothetical protein
LSTIDNLKIAARYEAKLGRGLIDQ